MGKSRAHQAPFPVQLSPPPVAQCWALPGGNPFSVSAIHLPGVPSAPPPDPCCLASEGWGPKLDLGGQRINRKGRVGISNRETWDLGGWGVSATWGLEQGRKGDGGVKHPRGLLQTGPSQASREA